MKLWIGSLCLVVGLDLVFCQEVRSEQDEKMSKFDPSQHLWLEEVEGEEALTWVREQNERSLSELQADGDFEADLADALEVLTSKERIPYGKVRGDYFYNFWQDEDHVRGIWRRTPLEQYGTDDPEWETILDFDQLAEEEEKNWVFKGAHTFHDQESGKYFCLVALSDGGKDAVVRREFDIDLKSFVEGGFETPEAKQGMAWEDANTILIGTDWGEGSLTESGYPRIVKRWKRGTPMSGAETVIEGDLTDVSVSAFTIKRADGTLLSFASEADTFFTDTTWWLPGEGEEPVKVAIPPKSYLSGAYRGRMLVSLQQDWELAGDQSFISGDLVSFDLDEFLSTRELPEVSLVFRPQKNQALTGVSIGKETALISINEDVVGRILRLERDGDSWSIDPVELPGEGQADVAFSSIDESLMFISYEDFLTPTTLFQYDPVSRDLSGLLSLPEKFDSMGLVAEQFFARSTDGTRVPYFVIRHEEVDFDGMNPTLLYAYGGFQISLNPSYRSTIGRLWLEKGGVYVLANIRGGGEYGPEWHQAGLKLNRQRIYDDFISVAEELIERGITSPRHLGIMGGSNGGLLMGVMLNQRPDLWNAVVVQVPLLDMLRYHLLLAGASWVDEYGSPEVSGEREFLGKISPYHNFDPLKEYPVPFFVTSTKDDRVHPGHARKMARRFEEAALPFFYYENIDGGHSAAANQIERAKRIALEFTYLKNALF